MREKKMKYVDLWNFVDISVFIAFIYYFKASHNLEAELKKVYPNNAKVGAIDSQKIGVSVIPGAAADG